MPTPVQRFLGAVAASTISLSGLFYESSLTAITAGTTRTQAGATALTKEVNRIDTSTAPPAGSPGLGIPHPTLQ